MPKARTILVNGAVRKGERLVPPFAFEILMGVTFPAPSARVKVLKGELFIKRVIYLLLNFNMMFCTGY